MKPKWVCHLRAFVLLWLFLGISSNTKTTESENENIELHQHHLSDFLNDISVKTSEDLEPVESPVQAKPDQVSNVREVKVAVDEKEENKNPLEEPTENSKLVEIEFTGGFENNASVPDLSLTVGEAVQNESLVEKDVPSPKLSSESNEEYLSGGIEVPATETRPSVEVLESELEKQIAVNESLSSQSEGTDEIPSFSEWTQKVLAEAEKTGGNNGSASSTTTAKSVSSSKLRQKNYASPDCGAKLLSANPEAQHVSAVLDPARDEYLLSICSSKTWFVVELCEAIQAKRIEIANFELFSSSPKDFRVFISDRYPTREWALLGQFTATDERSIQSFALPHELFGKFVKVELDSHYGTRYYCPISLFRVYGTSEYEVLNIEDETRSHDDATEEETLEDVKVADNQNPGTLFDSATKAVLDIVKKATGVFSKTDQPVEILRDNGTEVTITEQDTSTCHSLRQTELPQINEGINSTLSCSWKKLGQLSSLPWLHVSLAQLCLNRTNSNATVYSRELELAEIIWGPALLAAVCHWAQIADISYELPTAAPCLNPPFVVDVVQVVEQLPDVPETTGNGTEEAAAVSSPPTVELDNMETWFPDVPETVVPSDVPPVETGGKMENPQYNTANGNAPDAKITAPLAATNGQGLSQQKESVFVRLSNRIKALERNMSLSSQYLEELSRRYKRQVDDMQKTLNRTLLTLNETLQQMNMKEQQQQIEVRFLKSEIEDLKKSFKDQLEENLTLRAQMVEHHLFLMLVELVLVAMLFVFCARRQFQRWLNQKLRSVQPPQVILPRNNLPITMETQSRVEEVKVPVSGVLHLDVSEKQQASPVPSVAGSSSSGCDSAFSYQVSGSTRSRDPSPAQETLSTRSKKKKRKRSLPLVTLAPNGRVQNIPTIQNRLKSDNWQWHSRAKSLASAVIKENFEPLDMRGSF